MKNQDKEEKRLFEIQAKEAAQQFFDAQEIEEIEEKERAAQVGSDSADSNDSASSQQSTPDTQQSDAQTLETMTVNELLDETAELRAKLKHMEEEDAPATAWTAVFDRLTQVLTILDEKYGLTGRMTMRR